MRATYAEDGALFGNREYSRAIHGNLIENLVQRCHQACVPFVQEH